MASSAKQQHQQDQRERSKSPLRVDNFKFRAQDFVSQSSYRHDSHRHGGDSRHTSDATGGSIKSTPSQEEHEDQEYFDSKYETLQFLGKGRTSKVFCCKNRQSGAIRAVKIWRKSRRNRRHTLQVRPLVDFDDIILEEEEDSSKLHNAKGDHPYNPDLKEFYLMQEFHNPNIPLIYELLEGPTHYYMVMEYKGGGTLEDDLKRQPGDRYPEDKAGFVLLVLLRTVNYLHTNTAGEKLPMEDDDSDDDNDQTEAKDKNHNNHHNRKVDNNSQLGSSSAHDNNVSTKTIIHCDLNLSNILLAPNREKIGRLRLADFGDAVVVDELHAYDDDQLAADTIDWHEPRGAKLPFMAPEMFAPDKTFSKASDMWSMGVIAYILVSGKYPFGQPNMTSTLDLQQQIKERIANDSLFDRDLVWNDVSQNAKDFIQSLLQIDPEDRPTAEDCMRHVWMEDIRDKALSDKLAGGGSQHHRHLIEHGKHVWSGLRETARRRKSSPKVLKQAALTLIASQLVLKEEKTYIDEVFQIMDVQADGVLSKDEVRQGYQEIFGKAVKESDLDVFFDKVDLGGTGTIEYSEFVIAAMNKKDLLHTDRLKKAFAAFDVDNTGFISAENLTAHMQSYLAEYDADEHVAVLESIISQVDRDGDGLISYEEFVAMMLHSSSGKRRRQGARRLMSRTNNTSRDSTVSLTTSMLMKEAPDVFASMTSSLSSGKRQSLWESSLQLTFTPENVIGRRDDHLTDSYELGEYIQSGAFGSVWFCKHKESGATRAVKYVKKSKRAKENELILREFNILRSLDHPNILKMFELFEDNAHYEIVMDACKGGDLCDEIDNYGAIAETGACLILHQVLMCLNYCHQRHIVHCDLKPDNILLEENKAINQIKIIDFGLAANLVGDQELAEKSVIDGRIREKRGTLRFMAPEVLAADYGPKVDIWACGVMAFLLLSDKFPFDGKDRPEIIGKIKACAYDFSAPIWQTISSEAKSFISTCMTVDEEKRPSAEEALQHPWIKTAREAVAMNFHNKEVCGAAEALDNMKHFQAHSVLAQAAYTFIASQLLLKEEKAKIDEIFRVIDVSCDGKLSKQEVKQGYLKVFGCELTDAEVDDMFERVDIDGTGFIEYSEFVVASLGQKDVLRKQHLKKVFEMFDTKKRGYISKGGLKRGLSSFMGEGEAISDDAIRRIMDEVDTTGDGRITFDEFTLLMLNAADATGKRKAGGKHKGGFMNGIQGFLHLFDKNH